MHNVGTEWLVDASGCREEALRDTEVVRALVKRVMAELHLRAVGRVMLYKFPEPGGVTALVMLTESHLACHTYPEHGIATFNLYCCRARPAWPWAERLEEMLGAKSVTVREVARVLEDEKVAVEDEACAPVAETEEKQFSLDNPASVILIDEL